MPTMYLPSEPYKGTYYVNGSAKTGMITNRVNLWKSNGGHVYARLKIDYSIVEMKASVIVSLQFARDNGDWGTYGTTSPYIDGACPAWTGTVSKGCAQRYTAEEALIPDSYFTTIATKTFSLNANATTGKFSKTIKVSASSGASRNLSLAEKSAVISFDGGYKLGGNPTLTVVDNGNNTAKISGKFGKAALNNVATTATVYWTTNGKLPDASKDYTFHKDFTATSEGDYSFNVSFGSTSTTVIAIIYSRFTYGHTSSNNESGSVKYYANPGAPGKPVLICRRNSPTLNETLKFVWRAAVEGNANAPIAGYSFRIYKNGKPITNTFFHTESTDTEYSFNARELGFSVGDQISMEIYAYAKNGTGAQIWTGGAAASAAVYSDRYTFINAGIIHIKQNGVWKEGQVFIKVNGVWKEADSIHIKQNGVWKEAL